MDRAVQHTVHQTDNSCRCRQSYRQDNGETVIVGVDSFIDRTMQWRDSNCGCGQSYRQDNAMERW